MPDDKLTPVQRSVMMILMAEAREVANAELTNDRKCELKKGLRERLLAAGLINVRKEGSRYYLDLTDAGWRWCREQCGVEVPAGSGHGGAAAYTILANVQRGLDRLGLSLAEFFARDDAAEDDDVVPDTAAAVVEGAGPTPPAPAASVPVGDLQARIRAAYQELAGRPGGWVRLAELRRLLAGAAHSEVDAALLALHRAPEVSIVPASDQLSLDGQDRAAAVRIGNQDKHLISIGSA